MKSIIYMMKERIYVCERKRERKRERERERERDMPPKK